MLASLITKTKAGHNQGAGKKACRSQLNTKRSSLGSRRAPTEQFQTRAHLVEPYSSGSRLTSVDTAVAAASQLPSYCSFDESRENW